jgi:hypothetical protein
MKWTAVFIGVAFLFQGPVAAMRQVTSDVIPAVAAALTEGYLYEDVGKRLATDLHAKLAKGHFDNVTNSVELGNVLTHLLQSESKDRHLNIWAPGGAPSALRDLGSPMFAKTELLSGNVGYLDIRTFTGTTADIDAAMHRVSGARALIVDLGNNLGGNPPIVQYLSTYLFAERTHLLSVFARGWPKPEERWTSDTVSGQRLANIPVFVLTSSRTFSAAESFAFGLQVTKRATIVGETTGGGGHFVTLKALPQAFRMTLPIGRAFDPRTNRGWQTDGIQPDMRVPYSQALSTALTAIQ